MAHDETTAAYLGAVNSLLREQAELQDKLTELHRVQARLSQIETTINLLRHLAGVLGEDVPRPATTATGPTGPVLPPRVFGGNVQLGGKVNVMVSGGPPPSLVEAAHTVLREFRRPAHIREIIQKMQERGWYTDREFEKIRVSLIPSLNRKAADGEVFTKAETGSVYGLVEWGEP